MVSIFKYYLWGQTDLNKKWFTVKMTLQIIVETLGVPNILELEIWNIWKIPGFSLGFEPRTFGSQYQASTTELNLEKKFLK